MNLNFCILASGSSGNCSVIWDEKTAVLIDCGCSSKYVVENLNKFGLLGKNNIPIYLHEDSYEDIYKKYGSKIEECVSIPFYKNIEIQNIFVEPFDAYHKDEMFPTHLGLLFLPH
ncbi:hypothetical protein AGMMS49921_04470 [Endomicrobiia bacterium]|nr:hypothetical protein AGMMS49921_04470 [Endomicrobiia bacterium]